MLSWSVSARAETALAISSQSFSRRSSGWRRRGAAPALRPEKKDPPPDCSEGGESFTATPIKGVSGGLGSDGVVHLVLNRVRRMLESIDLFVFQLDIGFDLVARENVAL